MSKKVKYEISNSEYNPDHYMVVIDENLDGEDYTTIYISQLIIDKKFGVVRNVIRTDRYYPGTLLKNSNRHPRFIRDVFRSWYCKHKEMVLVANSHGDIIQQRLKGRRTYIVCLNCGKGKWIEEYIRAPYAYSYAGIKEKAEDDY